MKKELFPVFALKVNGTFWAPYVSTLEQAKTDFIFAVNCVDTKLFNNHENAYLYLIGMFNVVDGTVKNKPHVLISEGKKCKFPEGEAPLVTPKKGGDENGRKSL